MKTTTVLSALAVALPAFAAPAPATTAAPGSCPGNNNGVISSNNNIEYHISCGSQLKTDVIRHTDTEIGLQGCLSACDGTVGCNAVSFIPSSEGSLKGSCESRQKGSLSSDSNENAAVAIRLTPDATTITSWPSATKRAEPAFGGVAIHSGSEIQYNPVNANDTYFWLNRDSKAVDATGATVKDAQTQFLGGDGTLFLHTQVGGGEQVFVDAKGRLRFTIPYGPDSGSHTLASFKIDANKHLLYEDASWYACPLGEAYDNAYSVYAVAAVTADFANVCTSFSFLTSDSTATAVYQYA